MLFARIRSIPSLMLNWTRDCNIHLTFIYVNMQITDRSFGDSKDSNKIDITNLQNSHGAENWHKPEINYYK